MREKGLELFSKQQMIHIYKNTTKAIQIPLLSSGPISKIIIRANPIYISQAQAGKKCF